ncbi:MAG TPA: YCF48-related protein [Flavobacteriales bacterium]|nr:YCF48-related protein [Flavobacteriales bacterium]
MGRYISTLVFLLFTLTVFSQSVSFTEINIDTSYSFRALNVVNDSVAWVAGVNGKVGRSVDGGKTWKFNTVKGFEKADFRTLYAFDATTAIIANAGSPAVILRTTNAGRDWKEVYRNTNEAAFFDGVDFWDAKSGLIYGDPIDGKMMIMATGDAGKTWQLLPDEKKPVLEKGEASFAASGTNIRCFGASGVCIATGGTKSRLFYSADCGAHWKNIVVPMLQGGEAQGIFSFAGLIGKEFVLVGGDYTNETLKEKHVCYYSPQKKSWITPEKGTGGYRECVEFISENALIAVGPGGADLSINKGETWTEIKGMKKLHVIRKSRSGKLILAAGKGKIMRIEYK